MLYLCIVLLYMAQLNFSDRTAAEVKIQAAILNGKKSVKVEGKTIKLPEPQRTGTETQRIEYARQATDKILN